MRFDVLDVANRKDRWFARNVAMVTSLYRIMALSFENNAFISWRILRERVRHATKRFVLQRPQCNVVCHLILKLDVL